MRITFSHPLILLALPVLYGLTIFSMRFMHARTKEVRIKQVILRCMVFSLLVLSLSGMNVLKKDKLVATIFITDASDSAKENREQVTEFVNKAIAEKGEDDFVGIISMGRDSHIENLLSDTLVYHGIQTTVDSSATDLETAVNLAFSMMPEGYAKRIVLITDGRETHGDLVSTAALVTQSGCDLKILELPQSTSDEVYVKNVTLPKKVGSGENFNIQVEIESNVETSAKVFLYNGNTLTKQTSVLLTKGTNNLTFTDTQTEAGSISTYRVMIEPTSDTFSLNNEYAAFTHIAESKTILIIENSSDESKNLSNLLKSLGYEVKVSAPANAPKTLHDFLNYSSVILVNTPYSILPEGFTDNLDSYVKVYGKGLVVCGGRSAFGPGSYEDTVLEEILPVDMEVKGEFEQPASSIQFVIDRSGSMGTELDYSSKLTAAKAATIEAVKILREKDYCGVMFFDTVTTIVVPQDHPTNKDEIIDIISRVPGGGGTSIYPALDAAVRESLKSPAASRHIVLLTDGQDSQEGYEDLIDKINKAGITLSTVAIGADCNFDLLKKLAESCGGRVHLSLTGNDLPEIFTEEVYLTQNSYIIDEPCQPLLVSRDQITSGVFDEGMPTLYAYVGTTAKNDAHVLLASHRDDPLLAYRQYGLGRTAVWTSDVTGNWSKEFFTWNGNQKLWNNLIHFITESTIITGSYTETEAEGDNGTLHYHVGDENFTEKTRVEAVITTETGVSTNITLVQKAPGEFYGDFELGAPGVYTIAVNQYEGDTFLGSAPPTAAVKKYSSEYTFSENNTLLSDYSRLTGGRFINEPTEVFEDNLTYVKILKDQSRLILFIALLMFILDIAYRRFRFRILPKGLFKRFTKKKTVSDTNVNEDVISTIDSENLKDNGKSSSESQDNSTVKKEKKSEEKKKKNDKSNDLLDASQLLGRMKK